MRGSPKAWDPTRSIRDSISMHSSPRCPRVRQEARRKIGPDGSKDHGGIGNIYSEEILFQARIDPAERMDKVAPGELKRLFLEMSKVLRTAIAHGAGVRAAHRANAQRLAATRTQERRPLPPMPVASEDPEGREGRKTAVGFHALFEFERQRS